MVTNNLSDADDGMIIYLVKPCRKIQLPHDQDHDGSYIVIEKWNMENSHEHFEVKFGIWKSPLA